MDDKTQLVEFRGCGGLYNYSLGVAAVIQDEIRNNGIDEQSIHYAGISGGCGPAILMATGLNVSEMFHSLNKPLLAEVSTFWTGPVLYWNTHVKKHFLRILPDDAHASVSKRLRLAVTKIPRFTHVVIDEFASNEQLMDVFLASAHVPIYGRSLFATLDGAYYCDGALSCPPSITSDENIIAFPVAPCIWREFPRSSFLVSSDWSWANKLFDYGQEDAREHISEIRTFLRLG